MTDDTSPEVAGETVGGPLPAAGATPSFTIRKVPPPTAAERQARLDAMDRAIRFGAAPYRDAGGKTRYVFFREANNAPVEAWKRDRGAKRGYRRMQQARKAAGQMAWHPEDQIELAKRLGVIYHREGRSVEGAAERGLYDAIWRYEHVWDSFTVPRRYGRDIIDTGRIAAVAEEERRKLQAEDPRALGGFWVRDRKNRGLIYVVPNPDPEYVASADAALSNSATTTENDILAGGGGEGVLFGQADVEAIIADERETPSQKDAEAVEEKEINPALSYPDVPLPTLEKTWRVPEDAEASGYEPPIVNMDADRIKNILANEPAVFEIEDSIEGKVRKPVHEQEPLGYWEVWVHQDVIEQVAREERVDPDLLKALMYFENTRGRSYGALFEWLHVSDSILPMNIKESVWAGLVDEGETFADPIVNIRAAARLVRRILERLPHPTVAKLGSIWHFAGREKVSDNGARIADMYESRPWETMPQSFSEDALASMPTRRAFLDGYRRRREELKQRLASE